MPIISIVVCTQNRAGLLRGALASLANLATDDQFTYEIVVIDNGSTDDTPLVVREAAVGNSRVVRWVLEPRKGIVPARNRGIQEAHGQWVAFFDDDQLADERWLAELHRGAHDCRCRVVGGSVHLKFPGGEGRPLHPVVRMLLGEADFGQEKRAYGGRLTPGCGNLMVERHVFDEVGQFERAVDGRGEDTDLFSRIERAGIAAWYIPSALVHHLTPPERLADDYLLSLSRRMGEGIALRQCAALGRGRFALLLVAKAVRLALWQAPLAAAAFVQGNREAWLGRRCVTTINQRFIRRGAAELRTREASASAIRAVLPVGSTSLSQTSTSKI